MPPTRTIQSADSRSALRALRLFEAFGRALRPLSLSELAQLAGEPVSTSHGTVKSLQKAGYLYSPAQREIYPTRRLLELTGEIEAHHPVSVLVMPALERLRDTVNETVLLGTRQGDETLFLLALQGHHSIRFAARVGDRRPLHASSIGKALLGSMTPDELTRWLSSRVLPRVTSRTMVSASTLRRDLATSHRRGYYLTQGESVLDVMAIAMPLALGATSYGVSVAGPLQRVRKDKQRIVAALEKCVKELERQTRGA